MSEERLSLRLRQTEWGIISISSELRAIRIKMQNGNAFSSDGGLLRNIILKPSKNLKRTSRSPKSSSTSIIR
nr:MAG TPA: hypothetical protein [Caudoviricetes sp.]